MNTRSLLLKLSKLFPKKLAKQNKDYVGLMCGSLPKETHKIILCLDLDKQIIDEAISLNPDLIITHHPFIYGSKPKVLKRDLHKKEMVDKLIANKMCVYSMHTNFDTGHKGMNDALANALGLINVYSPSENAMMRIGELKEEMEIKTFGKFANNAFKVDYSLLINGGINKVKKVAIIGGGGSYSWPIAKMNGADIYISGDVSHHVRRDILNAEFNYLDMPHEIENIFMETLKNILLEIDSDLEIVVFNHEKNPILIK